MTLDRKSSASKVRSLVLAVATCVGPPLVACGGDGAGADASGDASLDASPDETSGVTDAGAGDASGDPDADTSVEPLVLEPLTQWVDPMIGTDGPGNVIPGALVPHGFVRASPVTNSGSGAIDAYEDGDGAIYGIAHMHLEGPGGSANGYGHLVVRPDWRPLEAIRGRVPLTLDSDSAAPGEYTAVVSSDGVQATVSATATQRVGIERFAFEGGDARRVVVDLGETRGTRAGASVEWTDQGMTGVARYDVHPGVGALVGDGSTGRLAVYYAITTSPPPTGHRAWRTGESADLEGDEPLSARDLIAALEYPDDVDEIEVRVALSLIDVGSAAASLAEVETASYDDLRAMADDAWNRVLNRVRVRGGDDERKTRFYTALYHAAMQPADGTELGGRFASAWGGEVEVFDAPGRYLSDDWCMWDTYRTSVPLRTLIEPEVARDQAWSLLHAYRQGGWLPKCPWFAAGYSRVMTGNPQVSALAEIAEIDPEGVDLPLLLEAVAHTSTADSNPFPSGLCGYLGLGTLPEYIANGFVSHECDPTQSASLTLEFAFADWAAARLEQTAEAAGVQSGWSWDPADRSASWRRHWDGSVGFMRGVNADGSWVEPFDPTSTADTNDFVEASAWVFSFFVPHDIPGLIELMGGREAFIARLDEFFDRGYFDPTNQPSFHIPYLYAHAGDWAGTARRVEETLARHYGVGRNGLPGNDDAGSTSAWLVLSELGIYPVAAGGAEYTLGVPGFDRAEVDVSRADEAPGTRWLVIERADVPTDELAGRWSLDGAELAGPTLPAARLLSGGLLAVE